LKLSILFSPVDSWPYLHPRTHALHFRTGVMRVQCMRLNTAPLFLAAPYCYWEELFLCRYPRQKRDDRLSSTLKSH